jgi:hypothetical protein
LNWSRERFSSFELQTPWPFLPVGLIDVVHTAEATPAKIQFLQRKSICIMILPDSTARTFIRTYTALLDMTARMLDMKATNEKLRGYYLKREALLKGEVAFDDVLAAVREENIELDAASLDAIRRLRLQHWIYLRDTRGGSIILDNEAPVSFQVLGLTEPLRKVIGSSGRLINAAIAPMGSVFIADGLMSTVLHIGPSMRGDLNERHKRTVQRGAYFKRYDENAPHFPILR